MKLVLIKFLVGGLAVLVSYIVSMVLPWKSSEVSLQLFSSVLSFNVYHGHAIW